MKYLITLLIIATAAGAYFHFYQASPPAPTVVVSPTPIATPEPVAVATPAPTPEPNYYAPDGVYFLAKAVNVPTDSGLIGLRLGTRLQKIGEDQYTTPDGLKVTLPADQVTNDLRIAARLVQYDAASRQAVAQWQKEQAAAALAQQQKSAEFSQEQQAKARPIATSAGVGRAGALDKPAEKNGSARYQPVHVIEIRNRTMEPGK